MKKTLYLHIGRPKVGSTALQHFLWQNRKALEKQGLLYPESVLHHRASHKLALVFQPNLPGFHSLAGQGPEEVYGALRVEAERSPASKLVASSENLFLVDPALVKQALGKTFDTRIICYVRRQDEVLASSFVQELKSGAVQIDEDITAYARDPERLKWLDYSTVLQRWADAFGQRRVIVRVFEPQQMSGSIYEDLLQIMEADITGLKLPKQRINPSPARDVLDFIRIINETPVGGPVVKHVFREPLLAASEQLGHSGGWDPQALVPTSIRRELLERFQASNAEVARSFLGRKDGVLFRQLQLPGDEAEDAYPGLTLDRFAHMAAATLSFQQQQIQQLKKQIEELRRQLPRRPD